MQLRPYQIKSLAAINAAWKAGKRNVCLVSPTGSGKCLGRGTPVLMFDGSIKSVEDVVVGDLLMGPDSTSRIVLSTCSGQEELHRITPIKGEPFVVNESHILSLKISGLDNCAGGDGRMYPSGTIANISVADYLKSNKTFKHIAKCWRTGVEFSDINKKLSIPPYILGVWLGDGTSRNTQITSVDSEVIAEYEAFAELNGFDFNMIKQKDRVTNYSITTGQGANKNPFFDELKRLNVIQNKHIPLEYLTRNRTDRLELLAGILDTDGYLSNHYDIIVKQEQFGKDIAYLCRSLGLAAYVNKCKKTCTNNGVTKDYYRISISGDLNLIPNRVARRKAAPRKQIKSVLVTGFKIEPIGVGDYFGFEISGNDRLFLLGDFTVTHNTITFSEAAKSEPGMTCAIAHRQELVGQMCMALAKDEVKHRIIGPDNVIRNIIRLQIEEYGRDFYDPNARCAVAGVDTIVARTKENSPSRMPLLQWGQQVNLWIQDESHHLLSSNKWGKAIAIFPNARGLGVTATPERADGKGIGREADGLFDHMVLGPSMRQLIDDGYLTDYRIFCPPSDLDLTTVNTGADGDYIRKQLALKTKSSSIMGDVVKHYMTIAPGKLGVTFAPDVETATEFAAGFNAAGVPAEVVSAKTPDNIRHAILKRFKRREILQLVNVDLFGEGFDLPAIEVVSMARATCSYGLYVQQFGRACRIMDGKDKAIIIDHVENVIRHGLPDRPRVWSLDRRERRSSSNQPDDVIPMRTCLKCMSPYERVLICCPICGAVHEPPGRNAPDMVDGDLYELDPEVLKAMRGEIEKIDEHPDNILTKMKRAGKDYVVAKGIANRHAERQEVQVNLRNAIAQWAGYQRAFNRSDRESQRRFYHTFGIDVMSAQALGRADAEKLMEQVQTGILKLDIEWRMKCLTT